MKPRSLYGSRKKELTAHAKAMPATAIVTVHRAAPLDRAPALDGALSDPTWASLPEMPLAFDVDTMAPASLHTVVRAGYDHAGLYLGIRCDDEHATELRATITQDGEPRLWTDDCVEVYLAAADEGRAYRQYIVNPLGARTAGGVAYDGSDLGPTPGAWAAAAARDAHGWGVALFIPFAEMGCGLVPEPGTLCRFAVRRFARGGRDRGAVSAPGAGHGQRDAFGLLLLTGTGRNTTNAWMCRCLPAAVVGRDLLYDNGVCLCRRGSTLRTAPWQEAVGKTTAALRTYARTLATRCPGYAEPVATGLARLAALPRVDTVFDAARVLAELRAVHANLLSRRLSAQHGVVCRLPGEQLGYFGWPTVARLPNGTLVVASSGLRSQHVCPFGKTVLNVSTDDGYTWWPPRVIQNSLIDDRDAGVTCLGSGKLLVSWFRSDTRIYGLPQWLPEAERRVWAATVAGWTDEKVHALLGSWVMLSDDAGANWGAPIRAPVSTPHGPLLLRNGTLLYLGKQYKTWKDMSLSLIAAARSADGGRNWETVGTVPIYPGTDPANYHEPHVMELPDGRLLGMIRIENHSGKALKAAGITSFSLMQTVSDDGGCTWSLPEPLGFHGSPPHLLRHSSGVLVLTYGYRLAPFGQRVAFSRDNGTTWDHDWIIRDDGPDSDLGYPSTVELADGGLFTVCYQKAGAGEKCSLLWSRWSLPPGVAPGV